MAVEALFEELVVDAKVTQVGAFKSYEASNLEVFLVIFLTLHLS
jgi:hypothetical protein